MFMIYPGDRVYYVDNGPSDTGLVVAYTNGGLYRYLVVWDDGDTPDWYSAGQIELCL